MKSLLSGPSTGPRRRTRGIPNETPSEPATRLRGTRRYIVWTTWGVVVFLSTILLTLGLATRMELQSRFYRGTGRLQSSGDLGLSFDQTAAGTVTLHPWRYGLAAQAGILEGDVLVAVDDRTADGDQLVRLLHEGRIGAPVTLTVQTGSRPERRYTLVRGGEILRFLIPLHVSAQLIPLYDVLGDLVFALLTLMVAGFIFWRRRDDWLAVLVSLILIMLFLGTAAAEPVNSLYPTHPAWMPALDFWSALAMAAMLLFLYVFPDGRFVPRVTAGLVLTWLVWNLAALAVPGLNPWRLAPTTSLLVALSWLASGILAQAYRFAFVSGRAQRQQTKWVAFGLAIMAVGVTMQLMHLWSGYPYARFAPIFDLVVYPAGRLLQLCLVLSLTLAILRDRLWNINVILNRALLYGALTACVIGLYVLLVVGLGALFQSTGNLAISLAATAVVAVLFQPLRDRLQRVVNRLMYGEQDPYRIMSRVGQRLGAAVTADAVLPAIVETVAQALKLPYTAVLLRQGDGFEKVASYGEEQAADGVRNADAALRMPLVYQTETIGQLVVAPRARGESFTVTDRRLLEEVAQLASTAAHAVRLTADLQRSREQLVMAREEERRRLRRDLHDGLGPSLATLTLQLDVARRLLAHDSAGADALLVELKKLTQAAIADIRRLVYELRPPALDDLGLVSALRLQASQLNQGDGPCISVEAPDELPQLPAAVEVAVYRIALEALTNVVRYSQAGQCTVRLTLMDMVHLEIADDGVGIPGERRAGVGLNSMRERAAELGGKCEIESSVGRGTRVVARLPYR